MPRATNNLQFIVQRLRHIAANKKASIPMQLRAIDRLVSVENSIKTGTPLYIVALSDQGTSTEEKPQGLSGPGVDDTVKAMLERAAKNRKRGGANADKLSESSPQ